MEAVKGEKINYKVFKNVLTAIVVIVGGFVFCVVTFMLFRCLYYYTNGIEGIANVYVYSNQTELEYIVDGELYQNDITESIHYNVETEKIYYLEKQPEKYCRMIWVQVSIYGYIFIAVLIVVRAILLKLARVIPSSFFYGKSVVWEKQILSFKRK